MNREKLPKRKIGMIILLLAIVLFFLATTGISGTLLVCGFIGFLVSLIYIVIKVFRKKFTKKLFTWPLAFFAALCIGTVTYPVPTADPVANQPQTVTAEATETETAVENTTEAPTVLLSDFKTVDEYLLAATAGTKKGTTTMVDKIGSIAKNDAKSASDQQLEDAVSCITEIYPDYFDSSETMEKTMYYGYLLAFAYENDQDPYSELGTDTYQIVKYVYLNTASIEDESTQENLKQITKDLAALSITTPYQESIEASREAASEKAKQESIEASREAASEKAKQESIEASKEAASEKAKQESIEASKEAASEKAKQESIEASKEAASKKAKQESIEASKKAATGKENGEMVWISATGSKYHNKPNCGNMNPDKAYQMSRSDAENAGYDACKKCY